MAKAAGVDVIVVDHHKCATQLPDGFAMVNPNRLDESDEGAAQGHLAAVGVAFLLGAALLRTLRGRGWFAGREEPKLIESARSRRARHRGGRRPVARPQPRLRDARAEGDGRAAQHRPRRARRRVPAPSRARMPRSRLRARPADQRRRPGRQIGSRRPPAHHRGSGRSRGDRRRARPAQRGAPRDRGGGAARPPRRCSGTQDNRAVAIVAGAGWHPGRDRDRRRAAEGEGSTAPPSSSRSARTASARARAARSRVSISARRCWRRRRAACSSPAAAMRWRRA